MLFKSTHNLDFEIAEWYTTEFTRFKIGTCEGLWCCTESYYGILAVNNKNKGNGHLQDVFDWFYNSCKRDKKGLLIMQVMNQLFKKHLIDKKGFKEYKGNYENSVIKTYKQIKDESKISTKKAVGMRSLRFSKSI